MGWKEVSKPCPRPPPGRHRASPRLSWSTACLQALGPGRAQWQLWPGGTEHTAGACSHRHQPARTHRVRGTSRSAQVGRELLQNSYQGVPAPEQSADQRESREACGAGALTGSVWLRDEGRPCVSRARGVHSRPCEGKASVETRTAQPCCHFPQPLFRAQR